MDRFDRIYALHKILSSYRHPVSRKVLEEKLEGSQATVKRIIEDMRDYLGAPLVYDRKRNGYYYDYGQAESSYELPGLWFNSSELFALLSTHRLLAEIQPGLLDSTIAPLKSRIERILQERHTGDGEIIHRVRILQMAARPVNIDHFRSITTALVERRRLHILYHGRERDKTTERTVSPQRLIYYRDNWYLDAWCHLREALRSFSLDRLQPVYLDDSPAEDISDEELDTYFASAYGAFAGQPVGVAVLHFSPQAAKWVADEQWHPQQKGKLMKNGGYELNIPYSDPRELIHDILKYGPDAEVIEPRELRLQVRKLLEQAVSRYRSS